VLCHATLLRVGDVPLQGINCMRSWFLTVHRCFSSICRRKGKVPAASRKLDSAISPQKGFLQGVLPWLVRISRGLRLETAAWSLILPRVPFQARNKPPPPAALAPSRTTVGRGRGEIYDVPPGVGRDPERSSESEREQVWRFGMHNFALTQVPEKSVSRMWMEAEGCAALCLVAFHSERHRRRR